MPASAEFMQVLRAHGVAAVLSGAGPLESFMLTAGDDLRLRRWEFGATHGLAVTEMSVGEPVRWSPKSRR